jgi:hypothetical protein
MSEVSSNEDDWTRAVTSDQGWSDSLTTYAKIKQSLDQSEEMSESPIKPLRKHAAFCREIAALDLATLPSLTKVTLQKSWY